MLNVTAELNTTSEADVPTSAEPLPGTSNIRLGRKIVGGTETTIEEHPHQIALLWRVQHICGGSIISDSWVLTAAHCLDWNPLNSEITIRSGSTLHASGGTVHEIYYYHMHDQYSKLGSVFDVATIRVTKPFSGPGRKIIPLSSTEWTPTMVVTVTGWGLLDDGSKPDRLHEVLLPTVDRTTCDQMFNSTVSTDMICAGAMGIDSCTGDSGGAAVVNGTQYGVVSWGTQRCGVGLPGVYANVAHPLIREFIERTTGVRSSV